MKKLLDDVAAILLPSEKVRMKKLILFDAFISLLDIGFLAILLLITNFYTGNHSASFPIISKDFLTHYPLAPILLFFILFGLKNFLAMIVFKLQSDFMYSVATRISGDNLRSYLDGNYMDYVNTDSSAQVRKISQQPIEFSYYILGGLQQIANQVLMILLATAAIILYNPVLFIFLLAILAPPVIMCGAYLKKKLTDVRKTGATISRQSIQYLQEALAGFVESNLYQRKNFFTKRYHDAQQKFNDFLSVQRVVQNVPSRLIELFAVFGLLLLVVINSYSASQLHFLTLGAFIAAAYKIIPGMVRIMNTTGQIKTYRFTLNELLQKKPAVAALPTKHEHVKLIQFNHVSFSYHDRHVLNDFSLLIRPGDFVGFSGISGKGKTTIIHLLLGFLKPSAGSVVINGEAATETERQRYWNRISYIKQQPFFIHDTAIRNVVFTENDYDQDQFSRASTVSGFQTFVNGDASKMIRENGKNISGGQRQRIALARALYKDFDLLILDEPFSEMDEAGEVEILLQLKQLSEQGKMIILVTHNQSSLAYCTKTISIGTN
ncbi:MAG: ATP-binding cassette domain-containing protein [Flavisolibacter sp.]